MIVAILMLPSANRRVLLCTIAVSSIALAQGPANASDQAATRGHAFVLTHCARCHAVERIGTSPLPEAPIFRTLHFRYPVEDLAETFAEGVSTGHAAMPAWKLNPERISDLITYLKTLEK